MAWAGRGFHHAFMHADADGAALLLAGWLVRAAVALIDAAPVEPIENAKAKGPL